MEKICGVHPSLLQFIDEINEEACERVRRLDLIRRGREKRPIYDEAWIPTLPVDYHEFPEQEVLGAKKPACCHDGCINDATATGYCSRHKQSNKRKADVSNEMVAINIPAKKARKSSSLTALEFGSLGYKFRKEFNDGWYEGEVIEIRIGAGKKFSLVGFSFS